MYGTCLALLRWAAYAVAQEHRIAQLRWAVRNKLPRTSRLLYDLRGRVA
jgi:hypothetical protein